MIVRRAFVRLAFALAGFAGLAAWAQTPETPLPLDPAIVHGKLENGLSYYILPNHEPEQRVVLRLVVRAGSLLEDDDQQGLAHFVEHMAFNGTTHFKKQALVDYLEKIGTRFGADLNATTMFESTVYKLQVPTDDEAVLRQAFVILQDWASGVSFDPEEVDKERGVLIEEWRGNRDADARIRDKQLPVLFHDSRYAQRLPIGLVDTLQHASAQTIARFYRDWYRPNLMAVIVVGDLPSERALALIKETFAGLTNPENERPHRTFPVPDHGKTLFAIDTDPELTSTSLEIYRKVEPRSMKTEADFRDRLVRQLRSGMLNDRLDERARDADPPYVTAYSFEDDLVITKRAEVQGAMIRDDRFAPAISALVGEAARARKFGYTASELERQKKDLMRGLEQAYKERDKTRSEKLVADLVDHFLEGNPAPGIAQLLELARRYLPGISLEEVNRQESPSTSEANRVIMISGPRKEGTGLPDQSAILAMLAAADQQTLTPYEENVSDAPLVATPPTPGKVVAEKQVEALGLTEWQLANGARVLLKPTQFKNDEIQFLAFSDGGTSLADDAHYTPALTATMLTNQSGLGAFDAIELEKKLAGKTVGVNASIDELEEGLSGSASPQDFETLLQLTYLFFTEPKIEDKVYASIITRFRSLLANRDASPQVVFGDQLNALLYQHHPRSKPFDLAALERMDQQASLAFFRERFRYGGDFTYVFVGNFEPEKIKPLIETYLGSLAAPPAPEHWRDVGLKYVEGEHSLKVARGLEPKSTVRMIYTGSWEWTPHNRFLLSCLNQILDIRLREILREDMGGVYGVGVRGGLARWPSSRFITSINFDCDPNRAEDLIKACKDELVRAQKEGFEASYLEKVKEALLREFEVNQQRNPFWLRNLAYYVQNGLDPLEILTYPQRVAALELGELQHAVQVLFNGKNQVLAVLEPEAKPAE